MSYYRGFNSFSGGGYPLTPAVKNLILINVGVFFLANIIKGAWTIFFGLVPALVFSRLMVWQLFTYMFIHVDLWHLLLNMLMLFFFGPALERLWSTREFLKFYFFCGIGAGLCSLVTAFNSIAPIIGASGALFGILVAYAMVFPDTEVLIFFLFPMKIRHAVILFAAVNLWGAITNPWGGIAYVAHLGGALCGYLYLKHDWARYNFLWSAAAKFRQKKNESRRRRQDQEEEREKQELDRLLDKVSRSGRESLTPREEEALRRYSQKRPG